MLRHWTRWRHQSSEWGFGWGGRVTYRVLGGADYLRHWTRWRHQTVSGLLRGQTWGLMFAQGLKSSFLFEALDKVEAPEQ